MGYYQYHPNQLFLIVGGGPPSAKKFIVPGPWDLEQPTNVILLEKPLSMLPHPHPDVEVLRAAYVLKLRQGLQVRKQSIVSGVRFKA